MSWIVKVLTGFKCKCGKTFDGENSLEHLYEHISKSTSGTHGLEDGVYTSLPSVELVLILIIVCLVIGGAIAYHFISPIDKNVILLKEKVNTLEKSNKHLTDEIEMIQAEGGFSSAGDNDNTKEKYKLTICTPNNPFDNGSGVNKILLYVKGNEYELPIGKCSTYVITSEWKNITLVQLFKDGNYLEYKIKLNITKDTKIKFTTGKDDYEFDSDPDDAIVRIL